MKRLLVLLLTCILFTAQVHAATNNGLKVAFDEFNYSLSVEWDQKDQAFHDKKVAEFKASLESMYANGLTNVDVINFMAAETKNETLKKDLEILSVNLALNKYSQNESFELVQKALGRYYSQGSSWMPERGQLLTYGVALLGVFMFAMFIKCLVSPGAEVTSYSYTSCGYGSCEDSGGVSCQM